MKKMTKIEQAKEKLFKVIRYYTCFHWDSVHSPEKDLKFHKGDNEAYFRESKGLKELSMDYIMSEEYEMPNNSEDWFRVDYDRKEVLFIADIAIFHKDYIKYIIEIVDETYIDDEKLKMINSCFDGIDYFQVKASDILNCEDLHNPNFLIYQQLDSLDKMINVVNGRMSYENTFIEKEVSLSDS
jgi:hypothetical protein